MDTRSVETKEEKEAVEHATASLIEHFVEYQGLSHADAVERTASTVKWLQLLGSLGEQEERFFMWIVRNLLRNDSPDFDAVGRHMEEFTAAQTVTDKERALKRLHTLYEESQAVQRYEH